MSDSWRFIINGWLCDDLAAS